MGVFVESGNLENSRDIVIDLWRKYLDVYKDKDVEYLIKKYDWYYNFIPYEKGEVYLLKEDKEHKAIGSGAVSIRRFKIANNSVLFGLIGNLLIHNEYRSLGPAIVLQKEIVCNVDKNIVVLYGLPPSMAESVIKRAGYKNIGYKVRYSKILKSYKVLLGIIKVSFIAKILSYLLDLMMKSLSKEFWKRFDREYIGEEIENVNYKFDNLWEKISNKFEIASIRNSEFLEWRFLKCPYRKYRIFTLSDQKKKAIYGYIVYDMIEEDVVKIADIFVDYTTKQFELLMKCFIKKQRKKGVRSIVMEIFCSEEIQKKFKEYGFKSRPQKIPVMVKCKQDKLSTIIENRNNWYLTSGDDNG